MKSAYEKLIETLEKLAVERLKQFGVRRTYLAHDLAQLATEMDPAELSDLVLSLIKKKEAMQRQGANEQSC